MSEQVPEVRKVTLGVLPHSGKVDELKKNPPARIEPTAGGFVPHGLRERTLEGLEAQIVEKLRTIYDPEIPVNIYDLGLIYEIEIAGDNTVAIKMTLTAPGCPVAGSLPPAVERKVEELAEVTSCKVELVWAPQWTREMMSEAAQLELGLL